MAVSLRSFPNSSSSQSDEKSKKVNGIPYYKFLYKFKIKIYLPIIFYTFYITYFYYNLPITFLHI